MAMDWVDVTARLVLPKYMHTTSCPNDYEWSGWTGLTGVPTKPLVQSGGVWRILEDDLLEQECPPMDPTCAGPPSGSVLAKLCAVMFDTPIVTDRLRVRYRLSADMVSRAANLEPWDDRMDPKILFSTGRLVDVHMGIYGLTFFGFGVSSMMDEPQPELAFLDSSQDQIAEVDTYSPFESPHPAYGVSLILGNAVRGEFIPALHSLYGTSSNPGCQQGLPYWIPPLQVWAYMEAPPSSGFWTDFENCKEVTP